MTFLQPWWLLLLGVIAIIFALHANRRRQITVTSLYLWQQVQGHDDLKRPTRRFPPLNLLLILQVLAVILLTLALARPQFTAGAPDHWVVLLDASVTMVEHGAEGDLTPLLDQRGSSLLTVVEVAGSPIVRATRLGDRRLLADMERTVTHENSDWLSAFRLIEGTVLEAESTLVTVLGPPDAIREADLLLAAMLPDAETEYVSVGPDLPNNRFVDVDVSHANGTWTVSGTVASVLSIAVATALARPRTGSAASATNAPSHWLWGEPARHRHDVTLRHTAMGYCIHHASSVFWAFAYEGLLERTRTQPWQAAPAIAAAAMTVDYGVVPRRLSPGFEGHLSRTGLIAVYAAFAAGLALASRGSRRLS